MSHILIVDDKFENRYLLCSLLRGHGHSVEEAGHGEEALALAQQSPPDLIVSDLLMPVMDGYTLLRQCKSHPRLAGVPFVVYTATFTEARDEQLALDLGAAAFLLKPTEPEVFVDRIHAILDAHAEGKLAAGQEAGQDESSLFRQYSQVIVHKLEEKARELKEANTQLELEIAEHRRAQDALQRTTEILTAVTNGTTDAVFVKDKEGKYLLCNPASARFMHRTMEEVIGRRDSDFFEEESARLIRANDLRVMEQAQIQTNEEVLTSQGETRVFLATKGPYFGADGSVNGIIGISRDITDRKHAEQALRDREEMLGLLLDSTAEAIYGTDLNGVCTFANRVCAQLLGFAAPEELIGRNLHAEMHRCGETARPCVVAAAIRAGESIHLEDEEFYRTNGQRFTAEFFSHPIRRDGEILGAVGTFLDVTRRKKLEDQLHHAQKMEAVGRLAGGVAHDFNNILSIIIGYSDIALESLPEDSPVRSDLTQVRLAANKAAALTRQLLVFSRRQVLKPQVLVLNRALMEAQKLLERLLGEDVVLEFQPAADLGAIKADPGQMEQVIINLAVNARDAMPHGGRITFRTRNVTLDEAYLSPHSSILPGDYVQMTVTDTGCGMDAETAARIFEPFFTTKSIEQGTGLGLATVYGIVEQSGGSISVYSELGHGTTFKLLFPRVAETVVQERPELPAPAQGGQETILFVEDDPALREIARRVIGGAGYKLLTAADGEEALRLADQHPGDIDLLVTDVVMPRMGGQKLAEELTRRRPFIRVLYMSGFTDDAIVRQGICHETIEFIDKPFTAEQIKGRIRQVLNKPALNGA